MLTGGKPQTLCQYAGRVVLIVNTASECGYTGQYEGLQALHKKYAAQGLVVLGFPSNAFGGQEPGSNKKIAELEQKNADTQKKLNEYKADSKEKWEMFKSEFNRDMDELGKAFSNMTVKNNK